MTRFRHLLPAAMLAACSLPAWAAHNDLVALINDYRAAPGACGGKPAHAVAAFDTPPALSRVAIGTGTFLELALEKAGYPSDHADAMFIGETGDAAAAMATLREHYCDRLLATDFAAAGAVRSRDGWYVVLANPLPPRQLPAPGNVADLVLAAVNAARAEPRQCGDRRYAAAPPLQLNRALDAAAQVHSEDMARLRYFSHQQQDGSVVGDRARHAGYTWRSIGENIASGLDSARAAVDGWLDSPGHCANIMNAGFAEMGIAYAINPERGTVYWTQVLGKAL